MSDSDHEGPWGASGNGAPSPDKEPSRGPKPAANPWIKQGGEGPSRSPFGAFGGGGGKGPIGEFPFDVDAWIRRVRARFDGPGGHGGALALAGLAVLAVVVLWLLSGFYQVAADQEGVVMRFGAFVRTDPPGLHYHLPTPIDEVLLPVVTSQNEIPIGFRRVARAGGEKTPSVPEESLMLTQDENIINVEFTVFWRVSDVVKYLFEIRSPDVTIKAAAESAMREVIGQNKLQFALTEGRSQIAEEAKIRLQALMDEYNAGIVVTQINLQTVSVPDDVREAFQKVVNARLERETLQNQAAEHVNKVIPDAKGQAAQMTQKAMAYRDQKVAVAKGDADRFREVQSAYSEARDVTARRLYLETLESVLGPAPKVIMDKASAGAGAVPYFPLRDLGLARPASEGGAP